MTAFNKDTDELMHDLMHTKDMSKFMNEIEGEILDESLSSFLKKMLAKYNCERKDAIRRAQLDTTYGYQILDGRKIPSRNKILRFALAIPLGIEETQIALYLGGAKKLYPRNKRDCYIIYALKNGISVMNVNEYFFANKEELI